MSSNVLSIEQRRSGPKRRRISTRPWPRARRSSRLQLLATVSRWLRRSKVGSLTIYASAIALAACGPKSEPVRALPPAPPAVAAPTLPPWPEGRPDPIATPEGTLLPPALALAVLEQLAAAELLPVAAQRALEEQIRRSDSWARSIVTVLSAEGDVREARGRASAGGVPWLTYLLSMLAVAVVAGGGGALFGVFAQ